MSLRTQIIVLRMPGDDPNRPRPAVGGFPYFNKRVCPSCQLTRDTPCAWALCPLKQRA